MSKTLLADILHSWQTGRCPYNSKLMNVRFQCLSNITLHFSLLMSPTWAADVASSGFLSSLIRRKRGNLREMPFSGSTWGQTDTITVRTQLLMHRENLSAATSQVVSHWINILKFKAQLLWKAFLGQDQIKLFLHFSFHQLSSVCKFLPLSRT